MGSNFSSGPFLNVKDLINLDLVRVKSLILRYTKTVDRNFEEVTFMTKKQFQWTLKLNDKQTYVLFRRFDPDGFGRVPMVDVFGALTLASSDNPGEKISFCFGLMDLDKDDHMSKIDLIMLIRCCTRGFSKFKMIDFPSMKTINRFIDEAFELETNTLNERGEISLGDVRAYILAHDLSRTYLANLGTEIAVVDTGKLVVQRAEVSAKLAELENKLKILNMEAHAEEEDRKRYIEERGGISQFVKLSEDAVAAFNKEKNKHADDNFEDQMEAMRANRDINAIDGVMTDAQRLRRLQRRKDGPAEDTNKSSIADATVFLTGCKPSQGKALGHDSALENSMGFKWDLLEPQSQDKLVKMDLDLLEDLFEAGGITLTDSESLMCLENIGMNQLGRHKMKDILSWYADYRTNPPNLHPDQWLVFCNEIRGTIDTLQSQVETFKKTVDMQFTTNKEMERVKEIFRPKKVDPNANLFGETRGAARLAAWQRQQQLEPASFVNLVGSFGPIEDEDDGEDENEEDGDGGDEMVAKMRKARAKLEAEMNKFKATMQLEIISKPEGAASERLPLLNAKKVLQFDFNEIEPGDVLEYVNTRLGGNEDSEDQGKSCAWFMIDVADNASDEEARALMIVAKNFFNSIPQDFREDMYDTVFGEVAVVDNSVAAPPKGGPPGPGEDVKGDQDESGAEANGDVIDSEDAGDGDGDSADGAENGEDGKRGAATKDTNDGGPSGAPRRIVLIALTHKEDHFRKYEDFMPPGLSVTRVFRHVMLEVNLKSSLEELYEKSLPFEHSDERLFGPQEDELGEDGMNPIRFAKLCRERMKAATDTIDNAEKMNIDQIKMHLEMRGLYQGGTIADMRLRLQRALQRQVDIMGFGEISSFGAEMVHKIFKVYDKDADDAFSLWELNQWLLDLGTETIIDQKDYEHLMQELELTVDENGLVTLDGITNYYERYGRLYEDMKRLGVGGLHDLMHGEFAFQCDFEAPAVQSFIDLLEQHSAAFPFLKSNLKKLSSLKDFIFEGTYPAVGDVPYMQNNRWFQEAVRTPGWIATQIHAMAELLADGDNGIMRSMKMNAIDTFGTYGSFDAKFSQVFNTKSKKKKKDSGDETVKGPTVEELLKDILPPLEDSAGIKKKIAQAMLEADSVRAFLRGNQLLNRTEKEAAREKLHQAELDTEGGIKFLHACVQSATAHTSAFYDAVRIFSSGIASVGYGCREMFIRASLKGFNFVKYLPRASGEPSLIRFRREDRVKRAMERKKAALSAMERERARRNMTEEEKERQKVEKAERAQARRDEEENTIFNEAYIGLTQAREENKGESFIRKFLEAWKKLALIRENRYPNTVKSAVTSNNYAVALKEFGHIDSAFIPESVAWATKAAKSISKVLEDFSQSFDQDTMKASPQAEAFVNKGKRIAGWVLILQNFITLLRDTVNTSALRKNIDVRVNLWRLQPRLSTKERHLLNSERKVEGMIALPYGDIKSNLQMTVTEVDEHLEVMRLEDEEAARLANVVIDKDSDRQTDDDTSVGGDNEEKTGVSALDPEYLALMARRDRAKLEKKRRKQRLEEQKLRTTSIKSRNKLYAMIQSDEITKFFTDRAEDPNLANEELPWLKPQAPPEDGSVISAVTNNMDGSIDNRYEYSGPDPGPGGLHPSAASVESMSQISNVSEFGAQKFPTFDNSIDNVSMLDSIAEYQGEFDDVTHRGGDVDDELSLQTTGSPKKGKGIFGWLFRGRDTD
jgi:hypothetical protein